MTWMDLLARCAWIGTFVLLVTFGASRALRGTPSAWRHFLWTVALAGLVMLPTIVRLTPKWNVKTPQAVVVSGDVPMPLTESVAVSARPAAPAWNPLPAAWLAGCVLTAVWFLVGRFRVRRLVRLAKPAAYARELMDSAGGNGVPVLESATAHTAMALGVWRPLVVLPVNAGKWPVERLRAALLHELMHVRRRDLAAQAVAQAACCLYWFHPLAWMAAKQLRREREQSCDDAVLGRGLTAHDYAGHLVAMVRASRGGSSAVVTMAEPSEIESRVRALLDVARDRRPLNRPAAFAMVAALAVVLLPLAVISVRAQAAPLQPQRVEAIAPAAEEPEQQAAPAPVERGALLGTVEDPSGARVPGCQVKARNLDGTNEEVTAADAAGGFRFASIPPGHYEVRVAAPGFKLLIMRMTVEANKASAVTARLMLGGLTEAVTVSAARSSNTRAMAAPANAGRIRVGGNVQPAMLISKVPPVYPDDLKAKGISGTVHLAGIVTKQGYLSDLRVLGSPDPGLSAAAMDAAMRWLYKPSLLNGEPVAVETAIDITFELQQ